MHVQELRELIVSKGRIEHKELVALIREKQKDIREFPKYHFVFYGQSCGSAQLSWDITVLAASKLIDIQYEAEDDFFCKPDTPIFYVSSEDGEGEQAEAPADGKQMVDVRDVLAVIRWEAFLLMSAEPEPLDKAIRLATMGQMIEKLCARFGVDRDACEQKREYDG